MGPNLTNAYHLLGLYAGRILKGEKPGELPVQMPTNFELVINKGTATSRLEIPTLLLVLAQKIIE